MMNYFELQLDNLVLYKGERRKVAGVFRYPFGPYSFALNLEGEAENIYSGVEPIAVTPESLLWIGFTPDPNTPNLYKNTGMAVTIENEAARWHGHSFRWLHLVQNLQSLVKMHPLYGLV